LGLDKAFLSLKAQQKSSKIKSFYEKAS